MTTPQAADERVRAAFRHVTLGLMEWQDPPELEERPTPKVYRCWDPQGEVEPFDVQADWEERA